MTPPKRRGGKPQTGPRAGGKARPGAAKAKATEPEEAGIIINGERITFNSLTLRELGEVEKLVGSPMDSIEFGSALTIGAVVCVVQRRTDPDAPDYDAVLDSINLGTMNRNADGDVKIGADPTRGASGD